MTIDDGWLRFDQGIKVRSERLVWTTSRGGGPGGQHVNTTDSRVTLHLLLDDILSSDPSFTGRLRRLLGRQVTAEGTLVMHCAEDRSQHRNRTLLLERLEALINQAAIRPKRRRPTKPSRGSVERRLKAKTERGQTKKRRQERPDRD